MSKRKVQVFLYGASMNLSVLSKAKLPKRAFAPASIHGYRMVISPISNLEEDGDSVVYGILANFTHAEIETLLESHMHSTSDMKFKYEPVLVHTRGGRITPAVTYMCHDMKGGTPDNDYIDTLIKAAANYGFPSHFIEAIEKFRP